MKRGLALDRFLSQVGQQFVAWLNRTTTAPGSSTEAALIEPARRASPGLSWLEDVADSRATAGPRDTMEQPMKSATAPMEVSSWWLRLVVGRRPLRTLVRAGVVAGVAILLFKVLLIPIRVTGNSMEPTYQNGRVNFLNRYAYVRGAPRRGDVVGVQVEGSRLVLLKRVLGLPGELVAVLDGRVAIDGRILDESYVKGIGQLRSRALRQLGEREYFIIGDNRGVSEYGVVRFGEIKGKVLF
jgi:signal peptidase I